MVSSAVCKPTVTFSIIIITWQPEVITRRKLFFKYHMLHLKYMADIKLFSRKYG